MSSATSIYVCNVVPQTHNTVDRPELTPPLLPPELRKECPSPAETQKFADEEEPLPQPTLYDKQEEPAPTTNADAGDLLLPPTMPYSKPKPATVKPSLQTNAGADEFLLPVSDLWSKKK